MTSSGSWRERRCTASTIRPPGAGWPQNEFVHTPARLPNAAESPDPVVDVEHKHEGADERSF